MLYLVKYSVTTNELQQSNSLTERGLISVKDELIKQKTLFFVTTAIYD